MTHQKLFDHMSQEKITGFSIGSQTAKNITNIDSGKILLYVKERLAELKAQEQRLEYLINDADSPKKYLKNWRIELTSLQFCRFEFEEILKNG